MTRPDLLVGRAAEVRRIRELVAELVAGSGHVLWIEGEPGIGKSTLLGTAWREAERLSCRRFRVVAEELAQRFPLRVLLDTLDPHRELLDAGATANTASRADPVMAAMEGLVMHVERLCADQPLLLMLDDVQFADDASLLVWQRLGRLVDQLPLLLATAGRPVPRREEIVRLRRGVLARGAAVLQLEPLPAEDVEALVGEITGALPGPRLRRLVGHAGGNPLYVREVVEAYQRNGTTWLSGAPAPAPLDAVIDDRLSYLSPAAYELLRTAALLGVEFSASALSAVSGQAPLAMIEVIEEAIAAGVLVESDQRLVFRHGLIQQALYCRLPAGLRAALHRQAAQTLDQAGLGAERVAEQLLLADTVDAWTVDWLTRCAEMLSYRGPRIAADLLERAIQTLPPGAPARPELEGHLATVMFRLGRYDDAERLTSRAMQDIADPDRLAWLMWTRVYSLIRLDRVDEAQAVVDGAIAAPDRLSAVWTARLRALQALVLAIPNRFEQSVAIAEAILAEGRIDPLATGYALHALFLSAVAHQRHHAAMDHVVDALATIGDDPQAGDLRVLLLSNRAALTVHLDRPAEAEVATAELLRAVERGTTPARLVMARLQAVEIWCDHGRWDDAMAELEALGPDGAVGLHPRSRLQLHGLTALIALHRAQDELADRHLAAIDADIDASESLHHSVHARMARALRAERRGDPAGALAELRVLCDPLHAESFNQVPVWLPDTVRLALADGDGAAAAEATGMAGERAARLGTPSYQALREWCEGLRARDPEPLLGAAKRLLSSGRRYLWARALEDAAVLLMGRGNSAAARRPYASASDLYSELGAAWDAQRAAVRLRALGVIRGRRGQRDRPATGWAALTPTELRVSELVTEGLPNPEIAARLFLSRRTVETHISHILLKLNVRSRVEIAREAAKNAVST